MKDYVIPILVSMASATVLSLTGWLALTTVELSDNSTAQTVMLQVLTKQIAALVNDVDSLETQQRNISEFVLLHPLSPHDGVEDLVDDALAPVMQILNRMEHSHPDGS